MLCSFVNSKFAVVVVGGGGESYYYYSLLEGEKGFCLTLVISFSTKEGTR